MKVAISEGVAEMMVHEVLLPFYASHPGIHVELTTDSVNGIMDKITTDAVHLGVCFNPPDHHDVTVIKQAEQPIGIVFPADHPLADLTRNLTLKEALRYPYVMLTPDYGLRRYISLIEFQHKVKFDVSLTTNSLQVLKQFVLSGAGLALMSSAGLWDSQTQERIRMRPIEDVILPEPEFCLLTRKNRPLPTAAIRLVDDIKSKLSVFIR